MKFLVAALAAVIAASPAAAGYRYVTVDGSALPGGPAVLGTVVTAINDGGLATGYYVTDDGFGGPGTYTGFTVNRDGGGFTSFVRAGFAQTGAAGVNNAGDIAGVSVTAFGQGTGFVRSGLDGSYTDIDPNLDPTFGVPSLYSEAIGINDSGAVTGYYVTNPAATVTTLAQYAHGFVAYGGIYTAIDVDVADGYGTQVTSINDFGLITGTYLGATDDLAHPFFGAFDPVTLAFFVVPSAFDPFGAPSSSIGNVTDNLYTTYNSIFPTPVSPVGFVSAAFVLDLLSGGFESVAVPGSAFTNIFGINEATDITGFYLSDTGLHGFIGTYVPEPATWMLMIAGFGLVGSQLRRRATMSVRG